MQQEKREFRTKKEFFAVFRWFYLVFGTLLLIGSVSNLLSGLWIRARRHRVFSVVVAAINCVQFPFGTVLGVFTIIVLMRDSVRELYEANGLMSHELMS